MFNLNSILLKIRVVKYNPKLIRFIATDLSKLSLRREAWELYKKRYNDYKHILYSSYLELQQDHVYHGVGYFQNESGNLINLDVSEPPRNWMDDYEYYSGAIDTGNGLERNVETVDLTIPLSNVPCNGCGALLHCNHSKRPGFLPSEIFKGRTQNELKSLICKRCHFLKYYNQAIDLEVTPEFYIKTISAIKNEFALAIVIVDLLDFPCSIWEGMHELLGSKRPIFIVGNKVDLLPRDSNTYLEHVKKCLKNEVLKNGFIELNVKHISLISAKTGYGIEELITQLQKIWQYKGNVYLLGCTNVGKSSLFNILLNSDYIHRKSIGLMRKATTCPWPGTTLHMLKFPIYRPSAKRVYKRVNRLHYESFIKAKKEKLRLQSARKTGNINDAMPVGTAGRTIFENVEDINDNFAMSMGTQPITTFNENSKIHQNARWVYDTPGVLNSEQITNLLTSQELEKLQPKKMISPRCYRLRPGMSLFIAGLSRLDFIKSDSGNLDWIKIFLFASFDLPTMIVETNYGVDIYNKYLNTPLMKVPMGNEERFQNWPGLECHPEEFIVKGYVLKTEIKDKNCSADITLSSSGWVGITVPSDVHCVFRAWTPHARGIYLRTPSLVPYAARLIGNRIRNSLAYNTSKPFVFKN